MKEVINNILGILGGSGILLTIVTFILNRKKYKTEVKQGTIQNKLDDTRYIDEAITRSTNTNADLLKKIDELTTDYLEISRKYMEIQQKYTAIFEIVKNYSCVVPECPQRILYKMQQVIDHTIEPNETHVTKE